MLLLAVFALGASDLAFRYDETRSRCQDAAGRPGWNLVEEDAMAEVECGDYRGRTLTYLSARHANLRGANFDEAELLYLNAMEGADLRGASFRGATLDMAELTGADLRGADLTGARLTDCPHPFISGACLKGARFDARTKLPFSREEAITRGMKPDPEFSR